MAEDGACPAIQCCRTIRLRFSGDTDTVASTPRSGCPSRGSPDVSFRAFIDESSVNRGDDSQEYLLCAAVIDVDACDATREALRPLLLPGQIKFHWTDESKKRQAEIVTKVVDLGPMSVVVAHLDARARKTERYRRKCLETLYHELMTMEVFDLTLESRSSAQDNNDAAHIVALQGAGLDRRMRIAHARGGDEPLLWIPDAVLGAINASHLGDQSHFDRLAATVILNTRTPGSRNP